MVLSGFAQKAQIEGKAGARGVMRDVLEHGEGANMDTELQGKVVLITGGGGGIARGIERAYAAEGAHLILTDVFAQGMQAAKEEIEREFGVEVLTIIADGGKEEDVRNAIEKGVGHFGGRLDVLVNNAQTSASGLTLLEHSEKDFDLAVYSGLYATFFYMKHAHPYLKKAKGSVVNFAAGAGIGGLPGQGSYAAAKEGIRGLSRVAAAEWGPDDININIVCPLVMTKKLEEFKAQYPDQYQKNLQNIPMGRFGDSEMDIGRTCVFLSSPAAAYITGETIMLQGGSRMRP